MRSILAVAAFAAALFAPLAAQAHRTWVLPSTTVLSGEDSWITVDAAVSNTLFVFEHQPLRLDGLVVTGPDGQPVIAQNPSTGRYRSTFDLQLNKPGTYRISVVASALTAAYKQGGEDKRWRGTAADLASAIPKEATDVVVTQTERRAETFVTRGAPTKDALKPVGKGIELEAISHPNDLAVGEPAKFRLLVDGQPAPNVEITLDQGGARYRKDASATKLSSGADGLFTLTLANPGMYWIEASLVDDKSGVAGRQRRLTYTATLEVLGD
jgi:uncharacterized GH25 family protein